MKLFYSAMLALFLVASGFEAKAQDKFEYGEVTYSPNGVLTRYVITTSTADEFKVVSDGSLTEGYVTNNFVPVNKVLNDLASKGWEVYNSTINGTGNNTMHYYYIRKKKS